MDNSKLKTVAIVGRPNVGKSTLFNRLIGKRQAIETPIPGTTRDRLYGEVFWRGQRFSLIDLAGIEKGSKNEIDQNIQAGIDMALESADLIIFLVDWNEKDNEADKIIARRLTKSKKKVILAINKADNLERINSIDEFKRLGQFDLVAVSAISGKNTGDFLDLVVKNLKKQKDIGEEKEPEGLIKLAIIGRPNVGKSTLLNNIIGKKRAIVSEEAGTTRDIIDAEFKFGSSTIKIIDTAGIRRKGKIKRGSIEDFSILRTYRALREADIAILIIDVEEGIVAQDAGILGQAKEWGKGVILAVNKIDLIEEEKNLYMGKTLVILKEKLNFTPWLPVVFISAEKKENIKILLKQVLEANKNRNTTIEQEELTKILHEVKALNFQLMSLKAIKQEKTKPPIFKLYYKGGKKPHETQIRFLENKIRDIYPMSGTPIFIDLINLTKK